MPGKLPVVFILDLDNTIIGDTTYYYHIKDLCKFISDSCKAKQLDTGSICTSQFKTRSLQAYFNNDTIRPHFKDFVENIQHYFPTAEFFIYSLGTQKHVKTYTQFIETFLGKQIFNRPLISREHVKNNSKHNYSKSVQFHLQQVLSCLRKKYKNIQESDLENRIIVIDDQSVWEDNDTHISRVVTCPEYSYTHIFDIDENLLKMMIQTDSDQLVEYTKDNPLVLLPDKGDSYTKYKMNYHLAMADLYRQYVNTNETALQDDFFLRLLKVIKKYHSHKHPFSEKHMKTIRNELN